MPPSDRPARRVNAAVDPPLAMGSSDVNAACATPGMSAKRERAFLIDTPDRRSSSA
jgi:hypothetical protein